MTLRIVLADAASDDLLDAAVFYEMQRPGLGSDFLRAIDDGFARIAEHPSAFRADDQGVRTAILRRFPYGVHFRPIGDRIEILAIWHQRRRPGAWRVRTTA